MAMRHISVVFFALSLTTIIFAAEVKLGPEVPFAGNVPRPTNIDFNCKTAASNGRDFLIGWADNLKDEFVVTRVHRDGTRAELQPRATGTPADCGSKLVPRGDGYLLVTLYGKSVRLDENGAPLSEPVDVSGNRGVSAVIAKGSKNLVVHNGYPHRGALIIDSEGVPLKQLDYNFDDFRFAGVHAGQFVFLTLSQVTPLKDRRWTLHTIDDDGKISAVEIPTAAIPDSAFPGAYFDDLRAVFGPESILLSFNDGYGYSVIGYDGSIIQAPVTLPNQLMNLISEVWTGRDFLLLFTSPFNSTSAAVRIVADGTTFDQKPLLNPSITGASFAVSPTDVLAFSAGYGTIRVAPSFDLLLTQTGPGVPLEVAAEQISPSFALGPRGLFGVWGDAPHYEVRGAINGRQFVIDRALAGGEATGWPSIAAGPHGFLVVWGHIARGSSPVDLLGRRYDLDGAPIDAAPFLIAHTSLLFSTWPYRYQPDITYGGGTFLVVWKSALEEIFTAQVSESGSVSLVRSIPPLASTPPPGNHHSQSGQAVWTGKDFVLPYYDYPNADYGRPNFVITRIDQSNGDLGASTHTAFDGFGIRSYRVGATAANGVITYAWEDRYALTLAQTSFDGTVLRGPRHNNDSVRVAALTMYSSPQIVWNGSEYVAVWYDWDYYGSGRQIIRAMRYDRQLNAIDIEPFNVAELAPTFEDPVLIPTVGGMIIGYRRDGENGIEQIVTRTLDGLGPDPRHRAVR
jgi:hypothetical protein